MNERTSRVLLALAMLACACKDQGGDAAEPRFVAVADGGAPAKPALFEQGAAVHREAESAARKGEFEGPVARIAASNILVAYAGAEKAAPTVKRGRQEAKAEADAIYSRLRGGASFEELANSLSDGPERGHGGRIGVFWTNKMLPEISKAALGVGVGEIAAPVESPYGFHIVRRDEVEEVFLAQILVAFEGAKGAPPTQGRTVEEAEKRAKEALAAAMKPGAEFGPAAQAYSDHPSKMVGGVMGPAFRGLLPMELERVAFALRENEIGGPVRTDEGFVVIKRLEEIHIRHILLSHKDAARKPSKTTRTKEEARALAEEVFGKLGRGDDFGALALRYSDCPSRVQGGELERTARGMMTKRFEDAAFALEVGQTSAVVETEFGFHVIERLP